MRPEKNTPPTSAVFDRLVLPLEAILAANPHAYACPSLSDQELIHLGIKRVIGEERSGRGFLQTIFHRQSRDLGVAHFFMSLKSERRLKYNQHALRELQKVMALQRAAQDPFAAYHDLQDFDIYAGDGQYHKTSTHEEWIEGEKYAPQHFYALNLRSHALGHLCLAAYGGERKKESDIHALKRLSAEELRQGAKVGRKVLFVWDRACHDAAQWDQWKSSSGIYFLSRLREDMIPIPKEDLVVDLNDPVNRGIISDTMVETSGGVILRKVVYRCPLDGTVFIFLTNLPKRLRPGLVAFLYKTRWDIEKAFDQIKNKLLEQKAWAKDPIAKSAQATFICLAHNLLLLLEDALREEGIAWTRDQKRRQERLEQTLKNRQIQRDDVSQMILTIQRVTQTPLALLRWLRAFLFTDAPWWAAIDRLRAAYERFS